MFPSVIDNRVAHAETPVADEQLVQQRDQGIDAAPLRAKRPCDQHRFEQNRSKLECPRAHSHGTVGEHLSLGGATHKWLHDDFGCFHEVYALPFSRLRRLVYQPMISSTSSSTPAVANTAGIAHSG